MHLRHRHLACLFLLLTSLSATEGHALRSGNFTPGGRYISMLLSQRAAAGVISEPRIAGDASYKIEAFVLPPALRALHTAAWSMRPPAAQTAALQTAASHLS